MNFVIPNYLYYMCFGLLAGLSMYFTIGTLYINKIRYNITVATKEGDLKIITRKEKAIRFSLMCVSLIVIMISSFFIIPGGGSGAESTKIVVYGIGICSFLILSILDIKFGEVYVYELGFTNTFALFILPIIVNLVFGCRCISFGLGIAFVGYILIKVVNYLFNKELSIGGADIDTIGALVAASIGSVIAINRREELPIFVESFFLESLLTLIFVNFSVSLLIFFIVKAIKKSVKNNKIVETGNTDEISENGKEREEKAKQEMNFRCLPSFILIHAFVLFFILFY